MRIDWTHPLARGLQLCVVGSSPVDLTKQLAGPHSPTSFSETKEGAGLKDGAAGTAPLAGVNQRTLVANIGWSAYWRGYQYGAPPAFASLILCSYSNPNGSPFATWGIISDGTGTIWEAGGNGFHIATNAQFANPGNGFYSVGARNDGGFAPGNSAIFLNGVLQATGQGAGVTTTNTAQIFVGISNTITNAAYMWNRQLSDMEFRWLEYEPYGFIITDEMNFFASTGIPPTPPSNLLFAQAML